jgi:sugar transferase (PEP-CTERM/EpsH1 system associated)
MMQEGSAAVTDVPLVVHVIHQLRVGGLENGLVNIINTMPPSAYRHAILCAEDFSDFRDRIARPGVEVVALHRSRVGTWAMRRGLFEQFRRLRPAIVHSRNMSGLDALLPALLAGVRYRVHGEHGWDVDNLHGERLKPRLLRKLHSPLIGRYVAVSEDLKRHLVTSIGVDEGRVTHICNGVDTDRFSPDLPLELEMLPPSFRGPGVLRIGTVGRLQPVKDQATLLRAFAAARGSSATARAALRLVIVGGGPLEGELHALASSLDLGESCHFAGNRGDVAQVLRALDVFVLPSLNEGISNTILEAMASGLPAVVTAVGGNPELVPDGDVGLHFAPKDVPALSRHLLRYLGEPGSRAAHAAAARRRAVERYSQAAMVSAYQRLYDDMLAAGSSSARAKARLQR